MTSRATATWCRVARSQLSAGSPIRAGRHDTDEPVGEQRLRPARDTEAGRPDDQVTPYQIMGQPFRVGRQLREVDIDLVGGYWFQPTEQAEPGLAWLLERLAESGAELEEAG